MNPTFNSMLSAMGFNRVENPCANCKHSGQTIDDKVLACFYWNAFTKQGETCDKWEAK